MFKIKNIMAPEFLKEIFNDRTVPYNLRRTSHFSSRNIHSVYNGSESISFLGPKIWDLVPQDVKLSEPVTIFKNKIKKWVPRGCPCRLCRSSKYRFYITISQGSNVDKYFKVKLFDMG